MMFALIPIGIAYTRDFMFIFKRFRFLAVLVLIIRVALANRIIVFASLTFLATASAVFHER